MLILLPYPTWQVIVPLHSCHFFLILLHTLLYSSLFKRNVPFCSASSQTTTAAGEKKATGISYFFTHSIQQQIRNTQKYVRKSSGGGGSSGVVGALCTSSIMLFVTIIPGYLSTTTPENHYLHLATFSVRVNMDISHHPLAWQDMQTEYHIVLFACLFISYTFYQTKHN